MDVVIDAYQQLFGVAPLGMALLCALVFLAGYVDAIAGGGGLISLPAYLIVGLPTHVAIATNKLSSAMGTTLTTWRFARSGYIQWKTAGMGVATALIGSALGSNLVMFVADFYLRVLLLVLLPVTAVYVMRSKAFDDESREALSSRRTVVISVVVALVVGAYDGFYGPGTGTFLMLLLTGAARMALKQAAGVTKAINLTTNITALAVFLLHGQVLIPMGLLAGVFGIGGNYLGSKSFSENGGAIARPITIVVLVVFFVKVIWDFVA